MAESTQLTTIRQTGTQSQNFGDAAAVRRRVGVSARDGNANSDSALQNALNRLDRILSSGQAPDETAPRGTYLNILV